MNNLFATTVEHFNKAMKEPPFNIQGRTFEPIEGDLHGNYYFALIHFVKVPHTGTEPKVTSRIPFANSVTFAIYKNILYGIHK